MPTRFGELNVGFLVSTVGLTNQRVYWANSTSESSRSRSGYIWSRS